MIKTLEVLFKNDKTGTRKTKRGNYEAYVSSHSSFVSLGTHDTERKARMAVRSYKRERMNNTLLNDGKRPEDGKVWGKKYVVFRDGTIYNNRGEKMSPSVDRSGYQHGLLNGKDERYHRVVAKCFCYNDDPKHKTDVNHKDGNKTNNSADNLEWVTRSENVKHAYDNGLEKKYYGEEWRKRHYANK